MAIALPLTLTLAILAFTRPVQSKVDDPQTPHVKHSSPTAEPAERSQAVAAISSEPDVPKEVWQARLATDKAALENYIEGSRYPFTSRPAAEQPDLVDPDQPFVSDMELTSDDGTVLHGFHLVTSQEKAFLQGAESSKLTLAIEDANNNAVPATFLRSELEVHRPQTASPTRAVLKYPVKFSDGGDVTAKDNVYSYTLHPSSLGIDDSVVEMEVIARLAYQGKNFSMHFPVSYAARPPARWMGGAVEELEGGSLVFDLPLEVNDPGQYEITGRVDDADGKPVAIVSFNEELAAGHQSVKLTVFGKLIRDAQPRLPLRLRDVDGFKLIPDASPDRMMLPRLAGTVLVSKLNAIEAFSAADWDDEVRSRHIRMLSDQVKEDNDALAKSQP